MAIQRTAARVKKYSPRQVFLDYTSKHYDTDKGRQRIVGYSVAMLLRYCDNGGKEWFLGMLRQFKGNEKEIRFALIRNAIGYAEEQGEHSALVAVIEFLWDQLLFSPYPFFPAADCLELLRMYANGEIKQAV
ncbi:hypothetical protein ACFL24_02685 [Patescibacteria group bacterium]